jgi:iron complex transport system permease protein
MQHRARLAARIYAPARARWAPFTGACVLLLFAALLATSVGSVPVGSQDVVRAFWHGLSGQLHGTTDTIIWRIRLPRVLLAAVVGGSLALAGVAYQGIFRNPLADPYLLGVASGASLGAAAAMVFAGTAGWLARFGVPISSFLGALLAVGAVVGLARRGSRVPVLSLILAGVVIGSTFTAATSFLMLAARDRAAAVLARLLGSFGLASWGDIVAVLPFLILACLAILLSSRALNLLQLGDEQAAQLGLPVERVKLTLIVLATLATAAAVSVAGIIGFVGLLVPHAVRLGVGPDHRALTPLALVLGALFMVLADLLARTVIAPAEIPIGIVTALTGGPFFLWLLRRQGAPS